MTTKYAWSSNEEEYYGCFDSHEEALNAAIDSTPEGERPEFFHTVEIIDTHERLLEGCSASYIADRVIEMFDELVSDFIPADEEIVEIIVPGNKLSEVEALREFGKAIVDLTFKHCTFNRYGVKPDRMMWKNDASSSDNPEDAPTFDPNTLSSFD